MNIRHLAAACFFAVLMGTASSVGTYLRPTTFLADINPKISLPNIFPAQFAGWQIDPSVIPLQAAPELQKALEEAYSETLSRTYINAAGQRIMLSVAYGRNQHRGMNWHRPEICYPSQGLPITVNTTRSLLQIDQRSIPINRLVAQNQSRIEPISYWLVVGDRLTNFGRAQKLVTLEYGLKGLIPDGMLIRVSSIDRDTDGAYLAQSQFIRQMLGAMSPASRQIVLGTRDPLLTSDLMPTR